MVLTVILIRCSTKAKLIEHSIKIYFGKDVYIG